MSLSLVIPVWNDQENLIRLITQCARMRIFDQVVIVDDASERPILLPSALEAAFTSIQIIRLEQQSGAGKARNIGAAQVTSEYFIFFDSDDEFTDDLLYLLQELRGKEFDICVYRYQDSTCRALGHLSQNKYDEGIWSLIDLSQTGPRLATENERWSLAEAGNFPWNKIYRTAFFREQALRCTEIMLHNDIELHWLSFLKAEKILISKRHCAIHHVHPKGNRLTNWRDTRRMQAFIAIEAVGAEMLGRAKTPLIARISFLRFLAGLFDWIRQTMPDDAVAEFDDRRRAFLKSQLDEATIMAYGRVDPIFALKSLLQMAPPSSEFEGLR